MQDMTLIEQQLKLNNIDFAKVRLSLCLPNNDGGFEWAIEEADEAIASYLHFLKMIIDSLSARSFRGPIYFNESKVLFEQAVPESMRRNVAIVWERHVLNTRQYTEDCQRLFADYLHYSPELLNEKLSFIT